MTDAGRAAPGQLPARAAGPDWRAWAPPIDPPTEGGLSEEEAEEIARDWWDEDPHLAAALMWESYAATLPQTLAVGQVATGSQSVSYSPAAPGGEFGLAIARANWHRSFTGSIGSVPLVSAAEEAGL